MNNSYILILAGGVGSRFWPKSRNNYPKQFIDILGLGKSLLQLTYQRFLHIAPPERIFILSNDQYADLIKDQLPSLSDSNLIMEPSRNNTAPCIAYASFKIASLDPQANIVIAPSDHLILNESSFLNEVQNALVNAENNDVLLTLGISPTRPDTGYGYLKYSGEIVNGANKVLKFLEKPDLKLAEEFVKSGDYLWNAGIFIWSVNSILKAFKKNALDIYNLFAEGVHIYNTAQEIDFINEKYPLSQNISIDYAVMERADNVYTIPGDFGWSDLGTWASLHETLPKDDSENTFSGYGASLMNTKNCVVQIPADKIAVIKDLNDYIVIDDGKVLLIYPKQLEQEIKSVSKDVVLNFGDQFS